MTALVIAGLWTLDHVELVPFARWRTEIDRVAPVPLLGSMHFVPSAYDAGINWSVERRTDEILDKIQPALDDFTPPVGPASSQP